MVSKEDKLLYDYEAVRTVTGSIVAMFEALNNSIRAAYENINRKSSSMRVIGVFMTRVVQK